MLRRLLLIALLTITAAVPAAAQITPPPDPDVPLIQLGPFGISPTLLLRDVGRDENVFNERENPKSDFTFTVVPRAEVVFKPRNMKIAYTAASEYVYYRDYESERSTNLSSSVRADATLGWFLPYVLARGTNSRQRFNTEVDERARYRERVYGGGFGVKVGTRLTFGASGRTIRLRFDEGETFRGESLARSFDSDVNAIEGSAGFQLTPFTLFSLVVSREQQRFEIARERDSDSIRVTPMFAFSPEAVLNGSVAIGYRRFKPRTSALPGYSGMVATVTIASTLWNRHRVETVFGRDIRYSYDEATPYYLATGGTVTVTSQLVGPFDVRLTGSRQLMAYRGRGTAASERPGDDTVSGYGGGIGYRFREQLRIGLNAEWVHRESQLAADREYRNRRIFASLTWGKQI
jgi:hypothetical protein